MFEVIRDALAVIGGSGIIILGLSKFLGDIWRDRLKERERKKTEIDIEAFRKDLSTRKIQTEQFLKSQYDVYVNLWQSLQGFRFIVDGLWQRVTRENILALANQLRKLKSQINDWSIFFEDDHLQELKRLLRILENFEAGKTNLLRIRSRENIPGYFTNEVERQIEINKKYKEEFEQLLEKLRVSFQRRLLQLDNK